mmetsp:Transcript_122255/g.212059  ORF Transcript_122255/g.212059 Transcript_122255/m.212059 type:complete len:85 (+) Transcript_122255:370-624(+)
MLPRCTPDSWMTQLIPWGTSSTTEKQNTIQVSSVTAPLTQSSPPPPKQATPALSRKTLHVYGNKTSQKSAKKNRQKKEEIPPVG